ncbi:metallophosphoesterase [Radiobacillus kanasensis]|uniref:metallophosphoesterase n=1 Tax=Radiobacillus kanasensis TaxID=2844358 RepID=UPI001E5C1656|nr:metallophosphoesterase [Radiobacillus kanasensis]UFU00088.1 metallophosphoesterase [Radiobacillus kanasensis]
MDKIKQLSIPNNSRIIVTSDIHGEIELFKNLLKKVHFTEEDYLIINGDLGEKGTNSKEVVRYIMELSSNNPRVHVIEGNCDAIVEDLLEENPLLIKYLCNRKHSLFNEWLEEIGFNLNEDSSIQEVKELLSNHFSKEIKWLSELPTVIETDHFIFVHAGLDNIENWQDTDRDTAVSIPTFLDKTHQANKYVIVGHWPVGNYSRDIPDNNPFIDEKKRIVAIDGGNVIKYTGQLNAFIIERSSIGDKFSHTYVDFLPSRNVLKDFRGDHGMIRAVGYPNYHIVPLEKGEHFTLCKQVETNQVLHVKNEYILQAENGHFTVKADVSCAQLSISEGDVVSLVDESCSGYTLIKKDGKVGWVAKDCLSRR